MDRLKYVLASMLIFVYFLLEYAWIPWADIEVYISVPFCYDDGPVRLDSYIYNVCVKIENVIVPVIILILTPFKKESKLMIAAFFLAFVEFFFTWNEPIAKLMLPKLLGWHPYIPVSTTPLKFASVAYFMASCIRKALEDFSNG